MINISRGFAVDTFDENIFRVALIRIESFNEATRDSFFLLFPETGRWK
jgi:hypothetical protein